MNEEPDTIVDIVEPFLLKIGFLKRTPRGRELTKLAREHMGFRGKTEDEARLL
jgi:Holliday junction DNA helicase RuvB